MYLGRIVESAPADEVFARPNHPYTQALLAEIPRLEATKRAYVPIKGEIPSPLDPPRGCHFHPRCPHSIPRCRAEAPRCARSPRATHRPATSTTPHDPTPRLPSHRPCRHTARRSCSTRPTAAPNIPKTSGLPCRWRRCARPRMRSSTSSTPAARATARRSSPRASRAPTSTPTDRSWTSTPRSSMRRGRGRRRRAARPSWASGSSGACSTPDEPIYARKLSVDEVRRRIIRFHQPYQKAVKDALDATHAHFGVGVARELPFDAGGEQRDLRRGPGKAARRLRPRRPRRHHLRPGVHRVRRRAAFRAWDTR